MVQKLVGRFRKVIKLLMQICGLFIRLCLQFKESKKSEVLPRATMDNQVGISHDIPVSIAVAHKGMMCLAPHLATFDSLPCRYPSELAGLVTQQKS